MKIFITNLESCFSTETLGKLFLPFGKIVSCRMIADKIGGTASMFGFVEMHVDKDGILAIKMLNGQMIAGRTISMRAIR
jgi:RNA recognition motif-containing protein